MKQYALALIVAAGVVGCSGSHASLPPSASTNDAAHQDTNSQSSRKVRDAGAAANEILADSPVVYYRLHESSGTIIADDSKNGRLGTYGGSVTVGGATIQNDYAPVFPGTASSSSTVATSATANALAPTGPFSVDFWVNVPSSLSGFHFLWTQPYQTAAGGYPAYVSMSGGTNLFITFQITTTAGTVTAYGTPTLGQANHVAMTWDGTNLKGYVNGALGGSATGSGFLTNYASPYAGFTVGGGYGPGSAGFNGSIWNLGMYGSALSLDRIAAHYNAGSAAGPQIVWQLGNPTLGQWKNAADATPCSQPTTSGTTASFPLTRTSDQVYHYPDPSSTARPGASSCVRDQINPYDPNTGSGSNYLLTMGAHYIFTFKTTVHFNGNTAYEGTSGGGLAADLPLLVFQTHDYGNTVQPDNPPSISLNIENSYHEATGSFGSAASPGNPVWFFHSVNDGLNPTIYDLPAYADTKTITEGETDTWRIDIVAQLQGNGGSVILQRNGQQVYANTNAYVCSSNSHGCFWNFGAYAAIWGNTEEPSGWNSSGIKIDVEGMTLYKQ